MTAPNAASTPLPSIRPRAPARRSTTPLGLSAAPRLQPIPAEASVDLETAAYAPIPPPHRHESGASPTPRPRLNPQRRRPSCGFVQSDPMGTAAGLLPCSPPESRSAALPIRRSSLSDVKKAAYPIYPLYALRGWVCRDSPAMGGPKTLRRDLASLCTVGEACQLPVTARAGGPRPSGRPPARCADARSRDRASRPLQSGGERTPARPRRGVTGRG